MKDQVSEQLKRARINFRMAMGMTLSEMLDAEHYAPEATQPPTQDTPLRTDRTDAYEERIDAGKQMAQPPENPLNAQPSMINIVHPTDDELRSRRKELLEDLDYINGALREQPDPAEEKMRGLENKITQLVNAVCEEREKMRGVYTVEQIEVAVKSMPASYLMLVPGEFLRELRALLAKSAQKERVIINEVEDGWFVKGPSETAYFRKSSGYTREVVERYATGLRAELEGSKGDE